MIMFDKKRTLNQIMGPEKKEGEGESPLHVMAGELMDAFKAGDKGAVAEALHAFVTSCGDGGSQEEG